MARIITPQDTLTALQATSLQEQLSSLPADAPYLAVLADGRVYVRSTEGLPTGLIAIWKDNPATMVPEHAGYRMATTRGYKLDEL